MLRKDRKDNEVEMEEKMKLISIREKEKEVAKKTIWELDKAMSLQQKHHLCSEFKSHAPFALEVLHQKSRSWD